jgi:hypothetical protein
MNAIRLVTEDAADPENPNRTIRRQRRYDPLDLMRRRDEIEGPHWIAATRFRDAFALAEGAREGGEGMRKEAWQRCHYSAMRADARAEYVSSTQAVGLRYNNVLIAIVLGYQPLRHFEREHRLRNGAAASLVVETLERLARHQATLSG